MIETAISLVVIVVGSFLVGSTLQRWKNDRKINLQRSHFVPVHLSFDLDDEDDK